MRSMSCLCRHDPTNLHTPIHMQAGAVWHAATEQRGGRLRGPAVGSESVVGKSLEPGPTGRCVRLRVQWCQG
ncbi:hypothetical protein XAB3213_2370002 [Xanthomonas citri pv. bilvae]|nr:hypothetical protein XAB3213_2370002 [Xanthomonas citri pv. bilvae]